jgi:SiaC family regulatory phosphoprotein
MKRLELEATVHTPHILLDADKGEYLIEGKSFPEDSKQFYQSTLDWLNDYRNEKPKRFKLNFNLFYLSSSSIIAVKQILMILMAYKTDGAEVEVVWYYDEDDDDIKKTGEDYAKITNLTFSYKINP